MHPAQRADTIAIIARSMEGRELLRPRMDHDETPTPRTERE
jgi:hypothetical protein